MNDFEWQIWVCYPSLTALHLCTHYTPQPTLHCSLFPLMGILCCFAVLRESGRTDFGAVPISGDTPSLFQASSWSHFGFVCGCVRHCLFKKWPLVKYWINTCLLCSRWGRFSVRVPGGCSFHFTPADWRHSHLAKMLWFLAVVSAALLSLRLFVLSVWSLCNERSGY